MSMEPLVFGPKFQYTDHIISKHCQQSMLSSNFKKKINVDEGTSAHLKYAKRGILKRNSEPNKKWKSVRIA